MGSKPRAVFDTGPLIHLAEIKKISFASLLYTIFITHEIQNECLRNKIPLQEVETLLVQALSAQSKDFARYLGEKYNLDLGEATAIALCRQENISLFFSDDLDARETAHTFSFEVHGTLAILLRAFREGLLTRDQTKKAVEELSASSTLFLTKDLKDWTLREIEGFNKKRVHLQ